MSTVYLKYKWLLFDLDNTLFNHEKSEYISLKKTFDKFNLILSVEIIKEFKEIDKTLWKLLEREKICVLDIPLKRFQLLINKVDLKIDPQELSDDYLLNYSNSIYLIAGALSVLKELKKCFKIAIICNGFSMQRQRINNSKIANYIDSIILSDEIGINKPNKLFFQLTLDIINYHQKQEILIIGDSLDSDIKGGLAFGIDTCWLNKDKQFNARAFIPTYEINKLRELLNILF